MNNSLYASVVAAIIILFAISSFAQDRNSAHDEPLLLLRLHTMSPDALGRELERDYFDVVGSFAPYSLDVVASQEERRMLEERGYEVRLLRKGRPLLERASTDAALNVVPPGYQSLAEIEAAMDSVEMNYPAIAVKVDITEKYGAPATYNGNHIYAMKLSDNVAEDEDEPATLIVSAHHSREIVTPVLALYIIERMTNDYGVDPRVTAAVNDNEIWVAPVWNPDGYHYVCTVDDMWRKNRRRFVNGVGVDLNRNYPHLWNSPHSGSTNVSSDIYKGPSPASEAETQTMLSFSHDAHFAKLIDFHSSGREVLWGYHDPTHPFDGWLQQEAIRLSEHAGYGGDSRRPSADGEHYQWQLAKNGCYAFLVETHTRFAPSYQSALDEASMIWPGVLWDLERPIPLSGHVTEVGSGNPIEATIELLEVNFTTGETNSSESAFGRYHIFAPTGDYHIRFSADGFLPADFTVSLHQDSAKVLEVSLTATSVSVSSGDKEQEPKIAERLELLGNYPNPFNPRTGIRYLLKSPGTVLLQIFDTKGYRIKDLFRGRQEKGVHEIAWDGTDDRGNRVASGVYFIRVLWQSDLLKDAAMRTGKIMLLK